MVVWWVEELRYGTNVKTARDSNDNAHSVVCPAAKWRPLIVPKPSVESDVSSAVPISVPESAQGINDPIEAQVTTTDVMVLASTQDTVGPICRSAEDCALVLNAIYGPDGKDNSVIDVPFNWDATADVTRLRMGYLRSAFEGNIANTAGDPDAPEFELATRANNQEPLPVIRSMGVQVVPFDLPDVPIPAIDFIRYAETAAFFDDIARNQNNKHLVKPRSP